MNNDYWCNSYTKTFFLFYTHKIYKNDYAHQLTTVELLVPNTEF